MIKLSQTKKRDVVLTLPWVVEGWLFFFSFCLCLHVLLHPHISWNVHAKESGWGHVQRVLARCIILIDQCFTEDGSFPNPARRPTAEISWALVSSFESFLTRADEKFPPSFMPIPPYNLGSNITITQTSNPSSIRKKRLDKSAFGASRTRIQTLACAVLVQTSFDRHTWEMGALAT